MSDTRMNLNELQRLVNGNRAKGAGGEQDDLIDMAAATLIEVDQTQFEKAFKPLVRCRTRSLRDCQRSTNLGQSGGNGRAPRNRCCSPEPL
jgi:hypothetical protein